MASAAAAPAASHVVPGRIAPTSSARRLGARRGARTAVVTLAAFAIGRWWIDDIPLAVFATFTGIALTGIADFGGTRRGRLAANAIAVIIGVGLTALGTWVSAQSVWVGCVAMFAVVSVVALSGLLGGYAAAGSNAVILFYVVAAGSAAPIAQIPSRVEGVLLGGALAVTAALLLWSESATSRTLEELADDLDRVGQRLSHLASGVRTSSDVSRPVRVRIDALVDRPAAPTETQRAELYLMNDVERLERLVSRLEATGASGPERDELRRAATALEETAIAIRQGTTPAAPDVVVPVGVERFSLLDRLGHVVASAVEHARSAVVGGRGSDAVVSDLAHGLRRFRANFTLRSVHVHDALRLAAGLAAAVAAVDVFGLQHGFWVAFATLTVVKSNVRATGRSSAQAILGTAMGFALAFALIAGLEPGVSVYIPLLPFVVGLAIYANVAISFLAGQAGFTLTIIVLFNLLGPAGWRIGIIRVEDVAAGAIIGFAIGALAWPRGAAAVIAAATADLVDAGSSYLDNVVGARPGTRAVREGASNGRREAAAAAVLAESAFSQYLGEHPEPAAAAAWAERLATANRLWYAADLIAAPPSDTRAQYEARAAADRLRAQAGALSSRLRGNVAITSHVPSAVEVRSPNSLAAWLDDLATDVEGARASLVV